MKENASTVAQDVQTPKSARNQPNLQYLSLASKKASLVFLKSKLVN